MIRGVDGKHPLPTLIGQAEERAAAAEERADGAERELGELRAKLSGL